ncbi:alpha-1,6-glucosidase domain-containing protein [Silanimonas lenta]|uniref:alpha-1,6-glucosidase domain-containing protein n=1 Tax=Silanimonas lenta TaxID=265429 RepID=UPI00041159DE|nr:alpha-1,6-glucosidase domain-containing protein [Silanimonas lenta]
MDTPLAHRRLRAARFLAALLAALALPPATALDGPLAAECRVPGGATLLEAWPDGLPAAQQAVWLDGERLRWQAPEEAARLVLVAPAGGRSLAPGTRLADGDGLRRLGAVDAPDEVDARFSHVPGRVFRLDRPLEASDWEAPPLVAALDADGRVLAATGVQLAGALDAVFAPHTNATPLGATLADGHTRFALWAPTAAAVRLCLFDAGGTLEQAGVQVLPMTKTARSGLWQIGQPGSLHGRRYAFLVEVWVPGLGRVRNRVTDPYALGLVADSRAAVVLDLAHPETRPAGWGSTPVPDTVQANTDLVIYELHVRDFSRDDASVPAEHRGRYLAFTHADSLGMRHLKRLAAAGLTDVHLLPVYDLASVPEQGCLEPALPPDAAPDSPTVQAVVGEVRGRDCFNWGYDPWHYTVPEGSYATDPDDAAGRVREFRAMVQALHAAGLRVGLDVVYNHTMAGGQDTQSVLDRIVPGYYHRLDAEGAITTSTCCPNTATEARMMARLMIDSAVVWARDYRIDGFRFDLMGHQPKAAMLALQQAVDAAAGRRIRLIGEGWDFGEVADGARFVQASQRSLPGSGIGTFSDRMRDAARGGGAGDRGEGLLQQGWLSGLHFTPNAAHQAQPAAASEAALRALDDRIRIGLAGSLREYAMQGADGETRPLSAFAYGDQPAGYVAEPGEVVNYTENHDNLTLFDSNALRLPLETTPMERAKVQVLGNALVLLSQGIAYLHAGQELMRSKSLDRNSYDSGDAFNRIDWSYSTNHFGIGLPPAWDNEDSWPWMAPVLARAETIAPGPEAIHHAVEGTLALLRIRRAEPLLRLERASEVQAALRFHNTGPESLPGLVVGQLDGHALPAAHPAHGRELLYLLNTAPKERRLALPSLGEGWRLHPDLDGLVEAPVPQAGQFVVPGRSALVFVR